MQLSVATWILVAAAFTVSLASGRDVKVYRRGKISLIDETQFKHPNEYSFDEDQEEDVDLENAYDEKVPYLPRYVLHKGGVNRGFTRVPIVTKKGSNTWSTPRPRTHKGEAYKTWSTPKLLPITKPTPPPKDVPRTTPVPKTTIIAKLAVPHLKAEKPVNPKKPEVKPTTPTTTEGPTTLGKSRKSFTRKPTTTSTEAEVGTTTRKAFTRRPSTKSSEEKAFTKKPKTVASTEEFTTEFQRKGARTKSTEASTESTPKKFFTRRPTTQSQEEASPEATSRKSFTRRPSTSASTEDSTVSPVAKKFFTRRPTTTSTEEPSSEASSRKVFTRRFKTTTTTTAAPETTEAASSIPLRDRLRPTLTTREPTPTMQRRFRVFTNPAPALPNPDEFSPQENLIARKELEKKLRFGTISEASDFAKKRKSKFSPQDVAADEPLDFDDSKESKLSNFHFSKFAQRFGVRRIVPVEATTPQGIIVVTPVTVSPAGGHHSVEQTVKSNAIILQPQKNRFFLPSNVTPNPSLFSPSTASTEAPKVLHRWSSSWSSWSSWDANGHQVSGSTRTFSTNESPETTTQQIFTRKRTQPSTVVTTASSSTSRASTRAPLKPPVIHHGRHRYRGPTYNCRVLMPVEDGRPSIHNDQSCPLKYPGFPADDTCRCTYEVEARDSNGCATGFLYTCKRINRA